MADKPKPKIFDEKCYELAEYFIPTRNSDGTLSQPPDKAVEAREDLAQYIQDMVELWLEGRGA